MASETETVVSTPPTTSVEEVKEKLYEEGHPTKQDSPPKECDEQVPKSEESPNVEPSSANSEEKTANIIEEPSTSIATILKAEEKREDKPIVSSVVKEDRDVTHVPESVTVAADVKQEEQPSIVDVPISSVEASEIAEEPLKVTSTIEPEEPLKVTAIEEPEKVIVTEKAVSEAECIKEEKREPAVPEVEEKAVLPIPKAEEKLEPYTIPEVEEEKPKAAIPEIEKKIEGAVPEVDEKLEPCTIPELEEKTEIKPAIIEVVEKSDTPTIPEVEEKPEQAIHEGEENPEKVPKTEEKAELAVSKFEEKSESTITEVVEKSEIVVPTIEEKSEIVVPAIEEKSELVVSEVEEKPELAIPEAEEKPELAIPEVKEKPEATIIEVVEKSDTTVPKVEEKTVAEEVEKCEVIAKPDSSLPSEVEEKELALPDKVKDIPILKEENIINDRDVLTPESSDQIVSTNPETPPEPDSSVPSKIEENSELSKAEEIAKPSLDPETKTSVEELPKEVATKKQSSTILTKVKKTIVKAKRAILGKSPSSKVVIAEPKAEDIEVK